VVATNGRSARQQQAERYSIGAVENALVLLRAIAEQDVLGLGEAAELAGVSKSTAYRLLATLEVAGLAERLPESGYRAGVEAMRWASRLLAGLDVRTVALPALKRLRDETGRRSISPSCATPAWSTSRSSRARRPSGWPTCPDPSCPSTRPPSARPSRCTSSRSGSLPSSARSRTSGSPPRPHDLAGLQCLARRDPDDGLRRRHGGDVHRRRLRGAQPCSPAAASSAP
jgi:hypothetical protein